VETQTKKEDREKNSQLANVGEHWKTFLTLAGAQGKKKFTFSPFPGNLTRTSEEKLLEVIAR